MATPEQLAALLNGLHALTAALTHGDQERRQGGGGGGSARRQIDDKHLRVPEFSGKMEHWQEWSFTFKRMIRSRNIDAYDLMTKAENAAEEVDEMQLSLEQDKISAELYDILCQSCNGDAKSILMNVQDMHGIKSWQQMYKKYNPRTVARMIQMLGEVTSPPKIKELKDVDMGMNRWEEKQKTLQREFKESFTPQMKIAIMTNMMPAAIQEFIYTTVNPDTTYEQIVDKVKVLIRNKVVSHMGPVPMDIGAVGNDWRDEWHEEEESIDVVSFQTQCHQCGGWGHLKRDCPTKGHGKGQSGGKAGGGKSWGKGGYKGGDSGGYKGGDSGGYKGGDIGSKGGGKGGQGKGGKGGYLGKCFNCGKQGHKKWECTEPTRTNAVEETSEGQTEGITDIGGVWFIGEVEVQYEKPKKKIKAEKVKKGIVNKNIVDKNMFEVLQEEEIEILEVGEKLTRKSAMNFNEADVRKPLASAVAVARAGNRIVLDLDTGSFIENKRTGEKMKVEMENNTFVFDVQIEDGDMVRIILDSGAGCNVWPRGKAAGGSKLMPAKPGMRMVAANNTEIKQYGQRMLNFRGIEVAAVEADAGFRRQA